MKRFKLLDLFLTFMKIGAFTFGGGYAMLPILSRELVDKKGWATDDELNDYFAIGQCTPGVIAVNVSTFIGNKRKGFLGGVIATIGVVFIPTIIILIIVMFLNHFAENEYVKDALAGIQACVCVLILNAVIKLWKKSIVDAVSFGMFLLALILSCISWFTSFSISPVILILSGGVLGIIIKQLGGKKK